MAEDRFKEWYRKNGEKYNERRRRHYQKDAAYRKRAKERSRAYKRANPGAARWLRLPPPKPDPRRSMLPRPLLVGGRSVQCMTTRAASEAIRVRTTTMAGWERRGVLPEPTYVDSCGHRWYSEEYVSALKAVVSKARREQWSATRFSEEVKKGVGGDGKSGESVASGRVAQA